MRLAKTIDELYDEVVSNGCDLVITTDIALSTALNRRIDRPMLGKFAMTPLNIAAEVAESVLGHRPLTDVELVKSISDETGYDIRFVHGEVEHIRDVGRHTSDVRKHLEHSRASKLIFDSYVKHDTIERVMVLFDSDRKDVKEDFFRNRRVAVIGLGESYDDDNDPGTFNQLEKHIYPDEHIEIDRFHRNREYSIDRIHEIGNDRQLANNVVDLITEDPDDYAIVINHASPIADAVRSALYTRGIPFVNALEVRDLVSIREFMEFLDLSLQMDILHVGDVRQLFLGFDGTIRPNIDGYLLDKVDPKDLWGRSPDIRELMTKVCELSFNQVMDRLFIGRDKRSLTLILDTTGYGEMTVSERTVAELRYLIDNMDELKHEEIIPDYEKEGVLLADCRGSAFIDKPIVFFLGMGQDWNADLVSRRYIDVEAEAYREMVRLEILLQQGSSRGYFINTTKNGKAARPCLIFDDLCKGEMDAFEKVAPGRVIKGRWTDGPGVSKLHRDDEPCPEHDIEVKFSKTALNRFHECPRAYMFSKLLTTPDKDVMEFGSLIHEYAEAYVTHPDLVLSKGDDIMEQYIYEKFCGLSSPVNSDLDMSKIRLQLENIRRMVDSNHISVPVDMKTEDAKENRILEWLQAEGRSSHCERRCVSDRYPLTGDFDLYWGEEIFDFKTGKMGDAKKIGEKLNIDNKVERYSELQPISYLALGEMAENPADSFNLFYAYGNDVNIIEGNSHPDDNIIRIERFDGDLHEAIYILLECMFNKAGLPEYCDREFIREFVGNIEKKLGAEMDSKKQYDKGLVPQGWANDTFLKEKAFATVKNSLINRVAIGQDRIMIPRETMGRFLEVVSEYEKSATASYSDDFIANPNIECSKCDYRSVCTRDVVIVEKEEDE